MARATATLVVVGTLWTTAATAQVPSSYSAGNSRLDPASESIVPQGIEIRADAGSECRLSLQPGDSTVRACAWERPTAFTIEWRQREVRLTVGRTIMRRAGPWLLGNAIRLSADGSARIIVSRVENEWARTIVAGDSSSDGPHETWIRGAHLADGWKIAGTIERLRPSARDAVTISVADDPLTPASAAEPPTFTGGIAGRYATEPSGGTLSARPRIRSPTARAAGSLTWTGAEDGLWSTPNNWSPTGPPADNDRLVFGSSADTRVMTNDLTGLVLGSVAIEGGGYSLGGRLAASTLVVDMNPTDTFTFTGDGAGVSSTTVNGGRLILGGSLGNVLIDGGTLLTRDGATITKIDAESGQIGSAGFEDGTVFVGLAGKDGLRLSNDTTFVVSICDGKLQTMKVFGDVNVNSAQLSVVLCPGYQPGPSDAFVIIDNDATDSVGGRFRGSQTVIVGDVTFALDYAGGSGNDIVIDVTAIGPVATPDLSIAKSHSPASFRVGSTGTYTVTVTNTGTGATSGVVGVTDTLPAGLTLSAIAGTGWNCTLATLSCTRSDPLAPNNSYPPIQITVVVSADLAGGTYVNTAEVSGGGDTTKATAADPTAIVRGVDVKITKVHAEHFVRGQPGTFTLEIRNIGSLATTAPLTVTDVLADGWTAVRYTSTDWTCTIASDGRQITCTRNAPLESAGTGDVHSDIQVAVDVSLSAPGIVSNTATISTGGTDVDVDPSNNSMTLGTPVRDAGVLLGSSDVTIFKSHQGSFMAGGRATFSITLQNVGAAPTSGRIQVRDVLPAGLTPRSATGSGWSCAITGQVVLCDYTNNLPPESPPSEPLTVEADVAANAAGDTNQADVVAVGDHNNRNDAALDKYAVIGPARLTLSKSHIGDFVQGQTGATYVLTIANAGQGPTTGQMTVTDRVPAVLRPTAAGGAGWECPIQGQLVTCTRDTPIALQETSVITITVDVSANAPSLVNNIATLSGGGDPARHDATDPTTIVGRPQLTITKSHLDPVLRGQRGLQFVLDVLNNGSNRTVGTVTVTDTLPAGLVPVDASGSGWNCVHQGQTATCSRSDELGDGESYPPIYLSVDVALDAASATNAATVAGGGDTTPDDNTASDLVAITSPGTPNLVLTKSHDGEFSQGQTGAIFRLRVDNRGAAASTDAVTVIDDLSPDLRPTAVSGDGWSCTIAGQRVTCTRAATLAPGASWPVIQITVDISATASSLVNTATLIGGGDSSPGDNTVTDATPISPSAPALRVAKRHDDPFVGGQTGAAYHITVSNGGTAPTAGEVTVTDSVPPGMTPTAASGVGWRCDVSGGLVTCRRSDSLAAGGSFPEILVLVNVAASASSAANVATVSGGGDTTPNGISAIDFTNINAPLDAAIDLTFSSNLIVGQDAEYIVRVANVGPGTIGGPTPVTVNLPDALIPIASAGNGWECRIVGNQFLCDQAGGFGSGEQFPELGLRVRVAAVAPMLTVSAIVEAAGDSNDGNDRAELTSASEVATASLQIRKFVNADRVVVGGSLTYRIEVRNDGDARVAGAIVRDLLPKGFVYTESESDVVSTTRSARRMGATNEQDELGWALGTLSVGEIVNLTYRVIVGADARSGPQDNKATVSGLGPAGEPVTAGPAIATVDVVVDVFSALQALVGRVFEDLDGDSVFTSADRPIANARVIVSTGQAAITDPDGLYNIPSLGGGSVAVSLDRSTVPGHLTIGETGPGERSWTRLLRTPAGGGTVLLQNFTLVAASGQQAELPADVVLAPPAPVQQSAASTGELLEKDAGRLPPRREYESRQGANLLIALGEVSFGQAAPEFEIFEKDGEAWGYGSVFLQTDVGSSLNRLTLAYDSRRHLNGTTNTDRLFELDPIDRQYPVFGDTSRRQEFATSNAHVFGRFERGQSYLMYGDLVGDLPSSAHDGGRWSSYQRHLTGAEIRLANVRGDGVIVRGAQPRTAYSRDVFSGSILGLLTLTQANVRLGTETIAVEVRDRRLPERVLSRTVLARAVDYELDPLAGTVFLRRHIGGFDAVLNLVQLVATYEYENSGFDNMVFSGRGTWEVGGLRVGGTFFTEEGTGEGRFSVAGVDVEHQLPRNGLLRLELPYSHGTPGVSTAIDLHRLDSPDPSDGFGIKFVVEQPVTFWNGRFSGSVLGADRLFRNPFSSTITPGAFVADGHAEFSPWASSRFRIGATGEDYSSTSVDANRTTVSASWTETIAQRLALTAGYDQRRLVRDRVETDSGLATAGARLTIGRFEASAAREQNVGDEDDPTYPDQTTVGARLKLGPQTSLFYTQRISDHPIVPVGDFTGTGFFAVPTTSELNLGVESRIADATQLTSRYQVDRGINGPDAFALIGVVTQIEMGRGFAGTFGGDWGKSIADASKDYKSGTAGISYVGSDRLKATARYEARHRQEFSGLFSAGLAARLSGGLTGLVRSEWLKSGAADTTSRSFLGAIAIRPITNDRAGLLVSYQHVHQDSFLPTAGPARETPGWRGRLSTDGYVQPIRRLEFHGKIAWMQTNDRAQFVDTYLGQVRARVTIQRLVDAAVESRYVRQPFTDSARRGTSAEIGIWPLADFRAAVGYSLDDSRDPLRSDLEGRAEGFYVTLSTKLSRLFNLMGSAPPAAASLANSATTVGGGK